jgi:hypothetical protein
MGESDTPVADPVDIPDSFEDRLREAIVIPADSDVAALREAAKNAAGSLGSGEALDLVRIAHRRPVPAEAEGRIRARVNAKSPVLATEGQGQLLATLAAITLVNVLVRPQYAPGLIPALAIRSAENQGWDPVHPDLAAFAASYLRDRALLLRVPVVQGHYWQQVKGEEQREIAKELEAVRQAAVREAGLQHESDELQWWLLCGERAATSLELASEITGMVNLFPQPPNMADFVRAKLTQPSRSSEAGAHAAPEIPVEIADFCPRLAAPDGANGDPSVDEVLADLDELTLIRALRERPIE